MSVINTNITSMIGQQNLNESKNALTTSMERLSSGLRINSAKDDAAGQAIANRMTSQINGLGQAQRNANDGISMAQTAEGGLDQINDNLQRIRELSVQAANGTNSQEDLNSIQDEIDQRLTEITRVSEETDFNGTKVLGENEGAADPTQRTVQIQVGADDSQVIELNLAQVNKETLNLAGFNVNGAGEIDNAAATETDLQTAGNVIASGGPGDYTLQEENTVASATDVLGQLADTDTVTITSDGAGTPVTNAAQLGFGSGTITGTLTSDGEGNLTTDVTDLAEGDAATMLTGSADAPTEATYTFSGGSQDILVDSTGNITDKDGNQLYLSAANELTLNDGGSGTAATATNLTAAVAADANAAGNSEIAISGGPTLSSDGDANNDLSVLGASLTNQEVATLSNDNNNFIETTVQSNGANTTIEDDGSVTSDFGGAGAAAVYVDGDDALVTNEFTETELFVREDNGGIVTDDTGVQYFTDQDGALTTEATTSTERSSLDDLDKAIAEVDSLRSDLGAVQNRFESAITNLSTNETNLSAARSRIEDADYATEVANMTRAQILQQAGTSVLAQANQLPQNVLSLLG
ncbi:flagellin FliC [Halomonas sp. A40-4]|uniref:flagellin N-terminal helical domain-containing protein n=1 Tax=Halomonas sp. A40-4 TaxID=2785909 RepID=UPI0018F01347|nr:flagellin [Halomonas sp. A40-4]QPL45643.1 flagellin FliC [Halomonas sp. A40-4]